MVSAGINYRETYFEFPELSKLQGEPNSETIYKLRNELKANAKSVDSNLSDGAQGHLALVLSDAQYALLTAQPFVRPVHPGPLIIPAGTTGPAGIVLRDAHQEQQRLFREVQGVEKALKQQIVQAIEAPYLLSLRDRNSNSLNGTVHEVLAHLRTKYGRISPQMLENREQELRDINYNTKDPIDVVFNAVEDYADFAELANQPMTQNQTIAKAYVTINKTGRFKQGIIDWNKKAEAIKTWVNFKVHFQQAHQDFRETTDVTLEESELQRNNANLVQQVVDGMQQHMDQDNNRDDNAEMMLQMANSANRSTETQDQLRAHLQQMQQSMSLLQAQVSNQQCFNPNQQGFNPTQYQGGRGYQGRGGFQGRGGYQGRGGRGRGRGQEGRGGNRQRNTSIYCWTHGGCGHTGASCMTKADGHQDNATFQNKMGGNARNCPP
jgi:hypothetical protein